MIVNIVLLTFFKNFYPSVNNNSLIKSIILNEYISNRKIRFTSSQYSNKIINEPEKKFNLPRYQLISYLMNVSDDLSHSAN